ncbi:hypothetical protein QFZ75_000907 [Streptomyces sp. V3I8]|uniref:hypothetical protein n=1 Tax=Streptomyces sp. V3I8 TaxID=3042279 RepID=UPI002781E860|nr:hypothetical protein [Streptomyces sp. V3I8]MDQ1034491.1 hypothetical protein [Streptomyces sp. V3I8]
MAQAAGRGAEYRHEGTRMRSPVMAPRGEPADAVRPGRTSGVSGRRTGRARHRRPRGARRAAGVRRPSPALLGHRFGGSSALEYLRTGAVVAGVAAVHAGLDLLDVLDVLDRD